MPTYEYVCDQCQHRFEKSQSITARHVRKCPHCGRMRLRRLIGAGGGVIFKGSGFYHTDYKMKKPGTGPKEQGKEKEKDRKPEQKAPDQKGKD